mmetsp:Transcript_15425/g.17494  ORF Transcript_15425/g.17494 Transcript_15425/m.17494 type:complete len:443 (-) Transcript_15425:909-2237(-)
MEGVDFLGWACGNFDASLLPGTLRVGRLSQKHIKENLHGILRLLVFDGDSMEMEYTNELSSSGFDMGQVGSPSDSSVGGFGDPERRGINIMMIHDNSGMSVVANEKHFALLENSGVVENMCWAQHTWRAFEIHLGAGEESQKIVSHISSVLSDREISILNFTTFETDLILVQEYQVGKSQSCFAEFARYGVEGMLEQIEQKEERGKQSNGNKEAHPLRSALMSGNANGTDRDRPPSEKTVRFTDDLKSKTNAYLQVLPKPLVLVQIGRNVLKECFFAIMKQLLANVDRSVITAPPLLGCIDSDKLSCIGSENVNGNRSRRENASSMPSMDATQRNSFFWAYLSSKDEVSLVIEESSLSEFPEGSLLECGKSWIGIKLCGKDIPFHETGVVKTMSKPYEAGVQTLNMSTYSTNVTLVREEDLDMAVNKIREALNGAETICIGL